MAPPVQRWGSLTAQRWGSRLGPCLALVLFACAGKTVGGGDTQAPDQHSAAEATTDTANNGATDAAGTADFPDAAVQAVDGAVDGVLAETAPPDSAPVDTDAPEDVGPDIVAVDVDMDAGGPDAGSPDSTPTPCKSDKQCSAMGMVCHVASGFCVDCVTTDDCAAGKQCKETVCVADTAVPPTCQAGQVACADALTLAVCKGDGSGYIAVACAPGTSCVDAACKTQACAPGAKVCSGTQVTQCDGNGQTSTVVEECATKGKACAQGACVTLPQPTGYHLRGGFETGQDAQAGAFRLLEQGWVSTISCGGTHCLRGGFQP